MANRIRDTIYDLTNGCCAYCGCKLDRSMFHVEHVYPKAIGGKDKANRLPSCPDCNLAKGARTTDEFRAYLENLMLTERQQYILSKYGVEVKKPKIVFYFEEHDIGYL